ncbi:MAG: hypothetical protein KDA41_19900, partial [Planctomycetales bacterium]|nr:hypothetical protein [Planctomycetales bacterium]
MPRSLVLALRRQDMALGSPLVCRWSWLAVALAWFVSAQSLEARRWTDRRGRGVDATFVRLLGEEVVLQLSNGKVVKVPLASLSDPDIAFVRGSLLDAGIRVWTDVSGRQVQAQYMRVADGKVYIKANGQTSPVEFTDLSTADRLYVREQLDEKSEQKLLPPADASESLPPPRAWADEDGRLVQGQFDRVASGKVFLAVEGATQVVPFEKLSDADQDYLRERLELQGLAHLLPPKRQPEPPAIEVAAVAPPSPEPEPTPSIAPPPLFIPPPPPVV